MSIDSLFTDIDNALANRGRAWKIALLGFVPWNICDSVEVS